MMRRISINANEQRTYNDKVLKIIPKLAVGTHVYFRDFFIGEPTSSRIGRKLFEDVIDRKVCLKLLGSYAREGYIVI